MWISNLRLPSAAGLGETMTGVATATGAGAGACTGAGAGRGAATAMAWPPDARTRIRSTSPAVSSAGPSAPWCLASKPRNASDDSSSTSTIGGLGLSSWRRSLSSSDSIWCVSSATSANPNVAEPPLIEWAHRKMAFSSSSSAVSRSRLSSICSIWSKFSPASSKKIS